MTTYNIAPMPPQMDPALRDRLGGCEPATIGHFRRNCFVDPQITCRHANGPVAGTAVTIALPPGDGTLLNHALRLLRPGDFLIVDQGGDRRHACWGAVLTDVACRIGLAGVVIDGLATDVLAIRQAGLPLWSRGLAALTTKLANGGGAMNHPVSVGGVVVNAGDAVLADENGILIMPASEAEAAATHAAEVEAEERRILARLANGEVLPDISGATRLVQGQTGR